jgi:F-type H+-transporting ATPase subunit delta
MKNSIIAKTYAQAVVKIAEEQNCSVFDEVAGFVGLLNKASDLESILFLNVFTFEEKKQILEDVFTKINLHKITQNFLTFLLNEKRLPLLPQIYKELIVIEDASKGFMKVNVEGSQDELDLQAKNAIEKYLQEKLNLKSDISYKKNDQISAGYKVVAGDNLLDATLKTQLNNFKNTFFE